MMDKDTGRPRGFGFVTFDGDEAVDRTLAQGLAIHGKPIEVKRAEPRGGMGEEKGGNKFNRRGQFNQRDNNQGGQFDGANDQNQMQGQGNQGGQQQGAQNGMSQAQMAQYWFKMQEYFKNMQQAMAANMGAQQAPAMGMMPQGMNPAMMQQMMAMNQQRMMSPGGTPMGPGGPMGPAAMQMQQMNMMGQGGGPGPQGYGPASPGEAMNRSLSGNNGQVFNPHQEQQAFEHAELTVDGGRPAFNAQEQMMFEQQKYERQQAARQNVRMQHHQFAGNNSFTGGGPTSWEGMYDDIPQPAMPPAGPRSNSGAGGHGGGGRGGKAQSAKSASPAVNAPANAPTGPKNAGRPGGNYRGGRGGGGNRGFHPYARGGG